MKEQSTRNQKTNRNKSLFLSISGPVLKSHSSLDSVFIILLIDCMFNAVFNVILAIYRRLVHLSLLSMGSFYQYFAQYFF